MESSIYGGIIAYFGVRMWDGGFLQSDTLKPFLSIRDKDFVFLAFKFLNSLKTP